MMRRRWCEMEGEGGIGIPAGSTGSGCMRSESEESGDPCEFREEGMLGAGHFVLFETGSSERRGAMFWILFDWRKASVVLFFEN
jgi:hypothetical protein